MRPDAERGINFMKKWRKILAAGLLAVLFSHAVCEQAVSAGSGKETVYAEARGLTRETAWEGKGPPSGESKKQGHSPQIMKKEAGTVKKEAAVRKEAADKAEKEKCLADMEETDRQKNPTDTEETSRQRNPADPEEADRQKNPDDSEDKEEPVTMGPEEDMPDSGHMLPKDSSMSSKKSDAEQDQEKEQKEEGQDTSEPVLEVQVPGQYTRISDMYQRSASTSTLQVGWQESLGSIDPGLLSLDDPYNVSIKYVDSSDTNNPDMRGKWRLLYCVQYQHNAPEGQITWDGAGRVSPSIAYLMYWGCRYWGKESLWPNYRTGYGWKYDALATQYAVHIVNGEFSLNTLYAHLKGSKKEQFYSIINKMVNDAKYSPYYTPFTDGWRTFEYTLSETSVTWTAQAYNGKEGFTTKSVGRPDRLQRVYYIQKRNSRQRCHSYLEGQRRCFCIQNLDSQNTIPAAAGKRCQSHGSNFRKSFPVSGGLGL